MECTEHSGVKMRNRKGFIFTMDAVFALTLATFAVSVLLYAHFAPGIIYQAPIKTARSTIDTLLELKTGQIVPTSPPYLQNGAIRLPPVEPAGYAVFNGESSHINVSDTYNGGPMTFSAWVYPETSGKKMVIMSAGWQLGVGPFGNLSFYSSAGSFPAGKLYSNTWSMVTVSISGDANPQVIIYIDGAVTANSKLSGNLPTGNSYKIGYNSSESYWLGYISNVQAYNSILYSDQIASMFTGGQHGLPVASKNVQFWLPLFGSASDHSIGRISTADSNVIFGYNGYSSAGFDYINNNDSALVSLALLYLYGHAASADALLQRLNLSNNTAIFINNTYAPGLTVAHFNGADSLITVKNTTLSINQRFTVSLWLNKSAYATTCESVIGMPSSAQLLIYSQTTAGCSAGSEANTIPTFKWKAYNGALYQLGFGKGLPAGKWEFIAAVMNGNVLTLYENGNQTAQYTGLNHTFVDNKTLNIGYGDSYFNGSIADVQIYNTSLSGSGIDELYSSGIAGGPVNYSSLVGWWPLLGLGTDRSGNGNIGFENNNVTYGHSGYEPASLIGAYQISKATLPLPMDTLSGNEVIGNISVVTWR